VQQQTKVWWTVLYGFCSKFYTLSETERILKIGYVLDKLQQVKPGAFFGTQCIHQCTSNCSFKNLWDMVWQWTTMLLKPAILTAEGQLQ